MTLTQRLIYLIVETKTVKKKYKDQNHKKNLRRRV